MAIWNTPVYMLIVAFRIFGGTPLNLKMSGMENILDQFYLDYDI